MTSCHLCDFEAQSFLVDRPDYEYGIAWQNDYHRCGNCGLVFADPMPSADVIPSFYAEYSTHSPGPVSILGKLSRQKTIKETVTAIGRDKGVRILDYGCGNGQFLKELRECGYTNSQGYDFDRHAVAAAQAIGIEATHEIDKISELFDVITLNHVIEHVIDPLNEIKTLSSYLNPGGLIIIRTPNNRSLMASICGSRWRGWETPRHLNVMNNKVLQSLVKKSGMKSENCFDSKAMFFGIFHESLRHPFWRNKIGKFIRHILSFVAYPIGAGEESVAVARKLN